jgi:hypothetical protein
MQPLKVRHIRAVVKLLGRPTTKRHEIQIGSFMRHGDTRFYKSNMGQFLDLCSVLNADPGALLNEILLDAKWEGKFIGMKKYTLGGKYAARKVRVSLKAVIRDVLHDVIALRIEADSKRALMDSIYKIAGSFNDDSDQMPNVDLMLGAQSWVAERADIEPASAVRSFLARAQQIIDLLKELHELVNKTEVAKSEGQLSD